MAKIPIKPTPRTPDKQPPMPNRQAILTSQELVDAQLSVKDSADVAAGSPGYRGSAVVVEPDADDAPGGAPDGDTDDYRDTTTLADRHEQRIGWFYAEMARQAPNRRLMARDEAMYDNEQWTQEQAAELKARGQDPIVYNEIGPTIDFLIGTERRSRVDFFVVAEDDDADTPPGQTTPSEDAINKTKLLKYLDDTNKAGFERSESAEDAFKAGFGVLEIAVRGDKSGPPVFAGSVPWREFWFDSRAKKDQSDARYNFRAKEVDLDVAIALFPGHADALRAAATSEDSTAGFRGSLRTNGLQGFDRADSGMSDGSDAFDTIISSVDFYNARERVTIIECWSREPRRKPMTQAGLGDPIEFRIRVSLMIEDVTLLETWSPYKHDRFPFVIVWAYRNRRTGMPYSPTRRLIGPQVGLNRRMARGLFEASFNQLEIEDNALSDSMNIEELHTELNDPNGILVFKAGALSGNKIRRGEIGGKAREQILFAESDRQALRAMSGVNEENRGLQSSATSRVAMDAKAERGSVGTAQLFDEQLLARQQEGELMLAMCEQFCIAPMTIRVAGESGPYQTERVRLNEPQADGTYLNDISARRAHFVVGEQAWKQSYAEGAFQQLMEMLTQLAPAAPQIVVALLDVVFDMHPNLPRKKAVLERIRAVNGQTDPDGKVTPEQAAARAKQAAMADAQYRLQMEQLAATVRELKAKGIKIEVDAVLQRVTALYEASQAAAVLGQAPALTPIADAILASAGYMDQAGSPMTLPPQAAPALMPPQPGPPALLQGDGAQQGIETARTTDGLQ